MPLSLEIPFWIISGLILGVLCHRGRIMHFLLATTAWYAFGIWTLTYKILVTYLHAEGIWEYIVGAGSLTVIELMILIIGDKIQSAKFSLHPVETEQSPNSPTSAITAEGINQGLEQARAEHGDNVAQVSFTVRHPVKSPDDIRVSQVKLTGNKSV